MKQMPHKTAEAPRTINEKLKKKRKHKHQLAYFLTFYMMLALLYYFLFNHLYDVLNCSYKSCY